MIAFLYRAFCVAFLIAAVHAKSQPSVTATYLFGIPCEEETFYSHERGIACAALNDSMLFVQTGDQIIRLYNVDGTQVSCVRHSLPRHASYMRWDSVQSTLVMLGFDIHCDRDSIFCWRIDTNGLLLEQKSFRWSDCASALVYGGFVPKTALNKAVRTLPKGSSYQWICHALRYDPSFNFLSYLLGRYVLFGRLDLKYLNVNRSSYNQEIEEYMKHGGGFKYYDQFTGATGFCKWQFGEGAKLYKSRTDCDGSPHEPKSAKQALSVIANNRVFVVVEYKGELAIYRGTYDE